MNDIYRLGGGVREIDRMMGRAFIRFRNKRADFFIGHADFDKKIRSELKIEDPISIIFVEKVLD
jgi:hypothetical protein